MDQRDSSELDDEKFYIRLSIRSSYSSEHTRIVFLFEEYNCRIYLLSSFMLKSELVLIGHGGFAELFRNLDVDWTIEKTLIKYLNMSFGLLI